MILELKLPFPPSTNHYKKVGALVKTKTGKMYQKRVNSRETVAFYYQVYMISKMNMPSEWLKFACSDEITFEVCVDLYPPNKRRYDLDNRLKVLLDSFVHAHIIKDDSQITRLVVEKMDNIEQGQVIVRIREFSHAPQ